MKLNTNICIVGGGPSGLLLGLLLAKQGIEVTVLESQPNFERNFRGEVYQPRFVQLMRQLNLDQYLDQFEHMKLSSGEVWGEQNLLFSLNYETDTPEAPYAIRMKQSVLLQAFYDLAKRYNNFHMYFNAKVKSLIKTEDQIEGVVAIVDHEEVYIQANLTVGADGRFSTVRKQGNFTYKYKTYDFDMIWFHAPAKDTRDSGLFFKVNETSNYIIIPHSSDMLQIGFTLPKGEWTKIKQGGIHAFTNELIKVFPNLKEYLEQLEDFHSFVPLKAESYFVEQWYKKGCVLVGDAAHCSSPLGAVGISLAVETSVVLAGLIHQSIKNKDPQFKELEKVTRLRSKEIRMVHRMQSVLGKSITKSPKGVKKVILSLIPVLAKTKIARVSERKLLLGMRPVPIDSSLIFEDNDGS